MARRRKDSRNKKINPTFYIFCEGPSEESYVNFLKSEYRLPSIHIKAKIGKNNISRNFIDNTKQGHPTHEKDVDFLLYDIDVQAMYDRLSGIESCRLLITNPCIELWFLLHYKNVTATMTSNQCVRDLTNRVPLYQKGKLEEKLKGKLRVKRLEAVKKAKRISGNGNPSSTIFELIELLENLKKG